MDHAAQEGAAKTCPSCGAIFDCRPDGTCWCNGLPPLKAIAAGSDCLCRACLEKMLARGPLKNSSALVEGEDYTREGETIVFTAFYHLRRGYCCGSGCRHCPYRERN